MKTLSIIIPVFNEDKTVSHILQQVLNQDLKSWNKEIIVVDDGSTDQSLEKLRPFRKKIKLFGHTKNLGKGKAIQTGVSQATGDAIIFQDADLEYDPADWPVLIKQLDNPNISVVYGSRNLISTKRGYYLYYIGGVLLSKLVNLLYSTYLTDICTGCKLFRSSVLKNLNFKSWGFEFDSEITAKLLKKGIQIKEIPIHYMPRTFADGKKISPWVGVIDVFTIIKNCL